MEAKKSTKNSSLISHPSSILIYGNGGETTMLHFANAEGKEWMVPLEGIKTGLLLYQPSGWKGHLIKRMMPLLGRWGWGRRLMHVKKTQGVLNEEISKTIGEALGMSGFEYAIFFGTPCADQKVTIQVAKDDRVMGYCKVSESERIGKKFSEEAQLLRELNEKGIKGIPKALACGKTENSFYYFVQSTTKSLQSTYPHEWGDKQEKFEKDLHERTRVTMPYEKTDFCRAIEGLKQRMSWLTIEQQETVKKAIDKIEQHYKGKTAEWSVYHGDFTPWNTFVDDGQLFVFDWEYALRSCPPELDKHHWFTQTWIFEKHYSAEKMSEEYHKKLANSNIFSYLCYLIVTIATYLGREEKPEDVENITLLDTWTGLIKRIIKG